MECLEGPDFASTPKASFRASEQPAFKKGTAEMRSRVIAFNSHKSKSTSKMVLEAVLALGVDSKGASLPAITKWILANYAVADSDRLKLHIKKVLTKFLDEGSIVRTKGSKGALGVSGSFQLSTSKPKKSSRTTRKIKEITESAESDFKSETVGRKPKQAKKKKARSVNESELDSSTVSVNTSIKDYFSSE